VDERTLYKTLAEAPDDEGHCMVFADWLHEQGDPMAEFLTLQLEHHRKKLETLRAQRVQDLLIMNWKRWAGELSRVLHRRACVYERGFLRVASGGVGAKSPVDARNHAHLERTLLPRACKRTEVVMTEGRGRAVGGRGQRDMCLASILPRTRYRLGFPQFSVR
jgi:uncharacterized protein (TIGR02996 family)